MRGTSRSRRSVAEVSTKPSAGVSAGRPFFAGVEGLRAVAALLVLLVHVAFVSGLTTAVGPAGDFTARAEVGVGVFFVISGFLLYRPWAVAHLDAAAGPSVGQFLLRRALRILPLYWVVLAATLLLVPRSRPHDVLDAVLLPALGQVYREQTVFLGVPQAWSLCVEVLFYLALPGYALLLGRLTRSRRIATLGRGARLRVELAGVAVLYTVGMLARFVFEATAPLPFPVWHGLLPVWFDLFALGFALALLSAYRGTGGSVGSPRRLAVVTTLCWCGAVVAYVVLARGIGLGRDPIFERGAGQAVAEQALWGMFSFLLLLPAVLGTPRALTGRPLAFLGLISYGIYLWHQLVVELLIEHTGADLFAVAFRVLLPVVLVGTCSLAAASYFAVERPGIGLGHRFRGRIQRRRERLAGFDGDGVDAPEPDERAPSEAVNTGGRPDGPRR